MIIGSGMIASAFMRTREALCRDTGLILYAAGVSDSACANVDEFKRDRGLLEHAIGDAPTSSLLVFISSCSILDEDSAKSPYVLHKLAMEGRVRQRRRHVIFRLPQVVGAGGNPKTLLNYIHARMRLRERFQVWARAKRNFIDVHHVTQIALDLIDRGGIEGEAISIANPYPTSMPDVVLGMERATAMKAQYDLVERGSAYAIDTSRTVNSIARCDVDFTGDYFEKLVRKYYGRPADT